MKQKHISRISMILFYVFAGLNHFVNPSFYLALIPPYFSNHWLINICSGLVEISLALLLIPVRSRKWAVYGIIIMLIAFVPAHVYFIERNSCVESLCIPTWVGWLRLVVIHPLLLYWAWSNRNP